MEGIRNLLENRRMHTPAQYTAGMIAALLVFSASAAAGEASVTWQNPEKYTDIRSGSQSVKSMRKSVEASLGGEFSDLAANLPPGYRLTVTVTDLDLAGEVDPIPMRQMNEVRVLKDIYFPRMIFDYELKDAGGAVLLGQPDVELKDMQYLSSLRTARSSDAYYHERRMIRDWFNRQVLPSVK